MFNNNNQAKNITPSNFSIKTYFLVSVLVIIFLMAFSAYTVIPGGSRGVVFSKLTGISDKVLQEGLNFKVPFVEEVIKIDVRSQKTELKLSSTSKDQQIVDVSVAFIYRVDADQVNKLYQETGLNFRDKIINPVFEDRVKEVMAQYKAEELIQKRNEVSINVLEEVKVKLKENYIIPEKLNILNIIFSESYNQAIEQKVVAEQQEQKAKNDLERIKIEAEQIRTKAEADADANLLKAKAEAEGIKIQQQALSKSKEVLSLRWIEKWDGQLPQVQSGQGQGFIFNLNK